MLEDQIMKNLMDRYGDIKDLEGIKQAMRQDGLDEVIDIFETLDFDAFVENHGEEMKNSIKNFVGAGTMPILECAESLTLDEEDTFFFNPKKCLTSCDGLCCKKRSYLMITYPDIFNILSSPWAQHLNIHSTRQLIEPEAPLIDIFMSEEYGLYLPYIRFLPVGAKPETRPEDAESNICPFLNPMEEVYSFHKLKPMKGRCKEAMGCILTNKKPGICRLSPIGKISGMKTGRVTYEYAEPVKGCPGCETDVEIRLMPYVKSLHSVIEKKEYLFFHKMLMAHHERENNGYDQKRFNSVLLEFYNIDRLLSQYGQTAKQRPRYSKLVEILITAAKGDFSLYNRFIETLK